MNPKGYVHVGVTNNTTDFFTTPQGGTLLKPMEGIKPVKEDNNLLERHQSQRMVSSQTLTVQYATVTEPTKKKTILLHVIPVKISSSDVKSITTYGLIDNDSSAVLDFQKKILGPAGPQVFIFGHQNKYSSRQKLYLRINPFTTKAAKSGWPEMANFS